MYNVAPYVERCVLSLEDQDIPREDYEIICINDGSPDNCREIIEYLQGRFSNIVLINQENQGVSQARNNGISHATGRYLLFIDPDDYIDSRSLNRILNNAESSCAEVDFLGFTFINEDGTVRRQIFNEFHANKIHLGTDTYFFARGDGQTDPDRMWAVLFDTEFIKSNDLLYLPGVPFLEDGEFIARILCLAERCIFDGHSFYQRTTRPGSATNSTLFKTKKASSGFLAAAKNLKQFQENKYLSKRQIFFLNQPICKFVLLVLNSALQKPFLKNYVKVRKELKESGLQRLEMKGVVKPYIYYAYAYNHINIIFFGWALLTELRQILRSFFSVGTIASKG